MKKLMTICLTLVTLLLLLPACAKTGSAENTQTVTFPAYVRTSGDESTMSGQDYLDQMNATPPFNVTVTLPDGWTTQPPAEGEASSLRGLFAIVNLYHEGNLMGHIGFNRFELYQDEIDPANYYKTVYPGLRLSSLFIWDPYTPVQATANGETGVADVTYLDPDEIDNYPGAMASVPQINTVGILSYDKELQVYIGIEFAPDVMTKEQVTEIAKTVSLSLHTA